MNNKAHLRWSDYDNSGDIIPDGYKRLKDGTIVNIEDFKEKSNMKDCKECIYSKIITPKNPDCIPEVVCTLSDKEFRDCLSNDKSRFEGNPLYLMCGGDKE